MPSEAAILRRAKPSFFRWPVFRSAVLRAAGVLLLVQSAMAWLTIFGAYGLDFLSMSQSAQILVGVTAVVAVMAGVGLWMLALWGVALWIICLALDVAPLVMMHPMRDLATILMQDPFVAASFGLFLLFILAAILSAFEAERSYRR
jgi:hypothetical protein